MSLYYLSGFDDLYEDEKPKPQGAKSKLMARRVALLKSELARKQQKGKPMQDDDDDYYPYGYESGDDADLDIIGRRSKAERKAARKQRQDKRKDKREDRKEERQERRETRREEGKGIFQRIAKVGAAPARAAFLTAVKLNAMKLATKLYKVYKKDPKKLETFWIKLGGKYSSLKSAIAQGSKQTVSGNGIGSVAAALATATPIVIASIKLFKELGIFENKSEEAELQKAADQGAIDLANDPSIEKAFAEMPEDGSESAVIPKSTAAKDLTKAASEGTDEGGDGMSSTQTALLVGGAAAAFFILPKILKG